jgi:hypothetical protein
MAILCRLWIVPATHEQFLEVEERVEQALMRSGGPPSGLMSNVVYPEGDGFVIAGIWRIEADANANVKDVLQPLLADVGLTVAETTVCPVWSFARP